MAMNRHRLIQVIDGLDFFFGELDVDTLWDNDIHLAADWGRAA